MKTVAIIQARMNSSRLPGKVMMPLAGLPMLQRIIERVKRATMPNKIIVAVPGDEEDGEIAALTADLGIGTFSSRHWHATMKIASDDLIGRFYHAAHDNDAEIIVRMCADNPFVEPAEIDRAVQFYLEKPRIFVSNMHEHQAFFNQQIRDQECSSINGYPDGIGCEVFSMSTLAWMQEYLKKPNLREHPHLYFHEQGLVESPKCPDEFARPDLKLDVNTEEDYKYVKDIYAVLFPKNPSFHITDVIDYLDAKK